AFAADVFRAGVERELEAGNERGVASERVVVRVGTSEELRGFERRALCGWFAGGEVAGPPHVPACDRTPWRPFFGAAFHFGGCGEQGGSDFGFRLEALEGEGESFADAVVAGGQHVGAAEAEHEHHLYRPATDAADLRQVLDDCV